jgi:S1-C subfamily serine protease
MTSSDRFHTPAGRNRTLACVVAVVLAPAWQGAPAPPEPVRVAVAEDIATAVPVGGGRVLTVAHVLAGAREVRVGGRPARVVHVDERLDLAELALAAPGDAAAPPRDLAPPRNAASPRPRDDTPPRGGARDVVVHVLRDGRAVALGARVKRRLMASIGGHTRPALELAARVRPGDSGAPVTDARGRVLGIVFAQGKRSAWAVALSSG